MWSTNGSTVDLFVRKTAVEGGVGKILDAANVRYSIVIDDLQKQIETANPPLDDIQYSENRNGKLNNFFFEKVMRRKSN